MSKKTTDNYKLTMETVRWFLNGLPKTDVYHLLKHGSRTLIQLQVKKRYKDFMSTVKWNREEWILNHGLSKVSAEIEEIQNRFEYFKTEYHYFHRYPYPMSKLHCLWLRLRYWKEIKHGWIIK